MIDRQIPDVTLKTRVRDDSIGGPNAFHWLDMSVREEFVGKKAVVFPLPGESKTAGVDAVYCIAVDDAFVTA